MVFLFLWDWFYTIYEAAYIGDYPWLWRGSITEYQELSWCQLCLCWHRSDNLWCQQWRQIWHHDASQFSVYITSDKHSPCATQACAMPCTCSIVSIPSFALQTQNVINTTFCRNNYVFITLCVCWMVSSRVDWEDFRSYGNSCFNMKTMFRYIDYSTPSLPTKAYTMLVHVPKFEKENLFADFQPKLLIWGRGARSSTFMHNSSNMRNKQMEIYACKILSCSIFHRLVPEKVIPFSWLREFAPPIEKYPLFAKMGTNMETRYTGGWGGWGWGHI